MRKFLLVLLMMIMLASCAYALELPDSVNEWHCVKEHITTLTPDADGVNRGRMVYRDYERESPQGIVHVILTEGTGTGSLYVPEKVRKPEGLTLSASEYKLLTIAGSKSIMEVHSYMPLVLAVNAGDNVVLTLESSSLNEHEIVSFAEEILSSWNITE